VNVSFPEVVSND